MITAQVLTVAAGLVGLTLAMDLAQRRVQVLIAHTRAATPPYRINPIHLQPVLFEHAVRMLGVRLLRISTRSGSSFPADVARCLIGFVGRGKVARTLTMLQ